MPSQPYATALKENEERSLLQIKKNEELFNHFKDLVKSGLSKEDIEAFFYRHVPENLLYEVRYILKISANFYINFVIFVH